MTKRLIAAFTVATTTIIVAGTHVIAQSSNSQGSNPQSANSQGSNAPRYQIWGSVFDQSANGGTQGGTGMTLTAVQLGPHNTTPSDNSDPNGPGSAGQYAVTGEFIGFTLTLDDGAVLGNTSGAAMVKAPSLSAKMPARGRRAGSHR